MAVVALAVAGEAAAQQCPPAGPPTDSTAIKARKRVPRPRCSGGVVVQALPPAGVGDTVRPTVHISPGSGSQGSSVAVTVTFGDNVALQHDLREVIFNGVDVTASFTYGGTTRAATATGTVQLVPGTNTVEAVVVDTAFLDRTAAVTYTYDVPPVASCPAGQFLAHYFRGRELAGAPIQSGCEARVDRDWPLGNVPNTVGGDEFSARWTGRFSFPGGLHRFTVRADDGVRLWVDGQLLIDKWINQAATDYSVVHEISAGEHDIRMEYYENSGSAVARLTWAEAPVPEGPPPTLPAAGGAVPTLEEVVRGIFRRVLERDATPGEVALWVGELQRSATTVRALVRSLAVWSEHVGMLQRRPSGAEAVAAVFRHVLGREATPAERDHWVPRIGDRGAAAVTAMVDELMQGSYYRQVMGEHGVPGRPVMLWDPRHPNLVLDPRTASADLERDLCLTVAVPGGAYECGDLRLAHALPAFRALNRARQPTLLYNSQHAHPTPVVTARVTLPAARGAPARVDAVLRAGPEYDPTAERARRSWPGAEWPAGQERQIALTYDAAGQPTGVHHFLLEVTATYADGSTERWTRRGERPIVNRKETYFGTGWWLAGLEHLVATHFNARLWVGGDGSTRLYEENPAAAGMWLGRTPDRGVDTLWTVTNYPGATHMRRLPGGARVYFDGYGRQIATVNRLDQHTLFEHDGEGRLTMLHVPMGPGYSANRSAYDFNFREDGTGMLDHVHARNLNGVTARTVTIYPVPGSRRLATIHDPGGGYLELAYWDPTRPGLINRRTDRRRASWGAHYTYGNAAHLVRAQMDMGPDGNDDDLITDFGAAEARGLAGAPLALASAYTLIDGPRSDAKDTTLVWVDHFGAPRAVRDATGRTTLLTRGDPRFPALVTRVDGPERRNAQGQEERHTVSAAYTARGKLAATTDWSVGRTVNGVVTRPTTRYDYADPHWPDFVTATYLPEGEVVRMKYDSATGNRVWQQPGDDATRRVTFGYNAARLVESVTEPGVAAERYGYDAYHNLQTVTSPMGFVTRFHNDVLGRTYRTESPINGTRVVVSEVTQFDAMDRVRVSKTEAPLDPAAATSPLQTLWVRNSYDAEGNVTAVDRWSTPDSARVDTIRTEFRYDPAGRKVAEHAPDATRADTTDNEVERLVYDFAGNVTTVHTRRRDAAGVPYAIRMTYDVLNRLTSRTVPAFSYAAADVGLGTVWGPRTTTNTVFRAYTIPTETSTFVFDDAQGVTRAINSNAEVIRTYALNGQLRSEVQRIRTVAGGDLSRHQYTIEYEYDLNGRRTGLKHPAQLSPGGTANEWTQYAYDVDGALSRVTDPLGNAFTFEYDRRGTLSALYRPGGIDEHFVYDADGRLTSNSVANRSGSFYRYNGAYIRNTGFGYDQRGKLRSTNNLVGTRDTLTATYSGLGHVVAGRQVSWGVNAAARVVRYSAREQMRYDALGNYLETVTSDSTTIENLQQPVSAPRSSYYRYHRGSGRLRATANTSIARPDTVQYDAQGNTRFTTPVGAESGQERMSYYGLDGVLRAADFRQSSGQGMRLVTSFEEYWYDALGRRVLVRAQRDCTNGAEGLDECQLDKVRRTVWDGDQELYEIQVPNQAGHDPENDGEVPVMALGTNTSTHLFDPNPFFGRVGYTHAAGVDRPLSVIRSGYVDRRTRSGASVAPERWGVFAMFPLWTPRGQVELAVYSDGGLFRCIAADRCVRGTWLGHHFVLERPKVQLDAWQGTLIKDKRDAAGTLYRRNRYLDPQTGRFTQEDPIGLAGGINLYGFAAGDPVNYGDPFGLCPRTLAASPVALADGPLPVADGVLAVTCVVELGVIGFRYYQAARAAESIVSAASRGGTEPTLPERDIVVDGDVTIRHHYREGDHGPAHMHVTGGGGPPRKIGPNGRPLSGEGELSRAQARVVAQNRSVIRRAGNKIGRWLKHREENAQ